MTAKIAMVAAMVTHSAVERSVRQDPAMVTKTKINGPATATIRTSQKTISGR